MKPQRRDFPGRRWLIVLLRTAHLVGVVGVGAGFIAAMPAAEQHAFALLLLASGATMLTLDVIAAPAYLLEFAGAATLAKLALVLWMVLDPAARLTLFWVILVLSVIVSHAPARARHRRLIA